MTKGEQSNAKGAEEKKTIETSVLFEKHVLWVLIIFIMLGVWYKFTPLIVVSTFLVLLTLIIEIWKKRSLHNVKPSLQFSKSRVFMDEELQIYASVFNDKYLPLVWLEWTFLKTNGFILGDDEGDTDTIRFLWLLWFQNVNLTLTAKAIKRGVYPMGQIILCSGDGFRFSEIEKSYELNQVVYVYPKLLPVNVERFRPMMQWGVAGKKGGGIEDPLLIEGTREYQAGDEIKRFNWRASARTGKLQTNIFQPVVIKQLMIYIDIEGFAITSNTEDTDEYRDYVLKKRQDFEHFLSVIASVAVKYKEEGIQIGFSSNGRNNLGEKMEKIYPCSNLTLFLDELAKITQSEGLQKMSTLDELRYRGHIPYPVFIFCHHITKKHYEWFQQYNKEADIHFYYKMETKYAKKLHKNGKSVNSFC